MEKEKTLTLGERAVNWTKSIGALVLAVGMIAGYLKSDDAQGNVDVLIKQLDVRVAKQEKIINAQSEKLEKMARRIIFFQGHHAGMTAGKLYAKAEKLEQDLEKLRSRKKIVQVVPKKSAVLRSTTQKKPKPKASDSIPRLHSKPFRKRGK